MISVHEVANTIILRSMTDAADGGEHITHLKLQKLLYFCQAWHLALYDEVLFNENMEAWIHGPVCRSVYTVFRGNGFSPITEMYSEPAHDTEICSFIGEVWTAYGQFSAKRLEQMTHEDKPWLDARGPISSASHCENVIDTNTMKDVYSQLAKA